MRKTKVAEAAETRCDAEVAEAAMQKFITWINFDHF